MHKFNLSDFTRGWIVGDFEPSLIRTKEFEFMVRHYSAGETEVAHVHKLAEEITVIVNGEFTMKGTTLGKGDIIHLKAGEVADFKCLKDGATAVIKTPSVIGDKYIV
jgi:quercetin dioxygenase-like cupin family protein